MKQESEPFSVIEAANAVVEKAEDEFITTLFEWIRNAEHKKEGCGCSQCVGELRRADHALTDEIDRVFEPSGNGEHYDDPLETGYIENEGNTDSFSK